MKKYASKVNKKKPIKKKNVDIKWVIIVSILAFLITLLFTTFSELIIRNLTVMISTFIVLLFIFLGIIFDMIGISVTVSDIKTFNSMATKKIRGSKTAIKLMKNSSKMSSFCNDVIGDICGIVSGSAGVTIAINLSNKYDVSLFLTTLIVTSIIASLTIGGKALGKSLAINKSNAILYRFSRVISIFVKD